MGLVVSLVKTVLIVLDSSVDVTRENGNDLVEQMIPCWYVLGVTFI